MQLRSRHIIPSGYSFSILETTHLSKWSSSCHFSAQFWSISRSSWRFKQSCVIEILWYNFVSSAKTINPHDPLNAPVTSL